MSLLPPFLRALDPTTARCDFCGHPVVESGAFLRSTIGDTPPVICGACILAAAAAIATDPGAKPAAAERCDGTVPP
jgi:hypothetical protein